jgi:drug/metabolite transporter (DMT)-like permease
LKNPHFLLFVTALVWASHWIVARSVIPYSSPVSMAFWRWVAAIAIIAPFALPSARAQWPAIRRAWRPILFFGTCGTVVYNVIAYVGLQNSTATNAVLFQSLSPALIPLIAWLLFRDRMSLTTAAGLCVSSLGVLAIVSRLNAHALLSLAVNPGDLWLLGSVALWSLYTACVRWQPRHLDPAVFMLAVMLAGMLTGLPLYLADLAAGGGAAFNATFIAGTLYLGGFTSVIAYILWNNGVRAVGPAKAGVYLHLIPILGAGMAVLFLGETLHAYHVVGLVLILGGVWLASRGRRP